MTASSRVSMGLGPRARTLSTKRLSKRTLELLQEPVEDYWRPTTRADCQKVSRPCVYAGCRHNLYADCRSNGTLILNFPDRDPGDMKESCALDLAEHGGMTLDEIGRAMNITRERARQILDIAIRKLPLRFLKEFSQHRVEQYESPLEAI